MKNRSPLFRQPLVDTWEVHRGISFFPLSETLFLQKQTNPSAIIWKLSAKDRDVIALTAHMQALTKEVVEKLYDERELVEFDTLNPGKLQQI